MRCNGDSRIIYSINYIFVGEGLCALPKKDFPLRGIPEISALIAIVKKRAIYKSPLRELIVVLFRVPFFSEDSILAKLGVKRQFDCHCRMRCGIDA